ncbi:uncharacterized protein LOC103570545 [Microplitis demolitor]|uniref:uncharacterized protein LOC103570545 n=1 Tax=Microplitis demolitor TaxID=69319 RepID=UPI0004CD83FF|nr:uncharacterized protein LOC103570545 [Microplitis demolitor]
MDLIKKKFLDWHENVERKTSCHFCSIKLSDEIYSCNFGHDVCRKCKTHSCIACKKSSFFRNNVAEFLITELNKLKNDVESLDESAFEIKKTEKSAKKLNTSTQTKIVRNHKICMVTEKDIKNSSENKSSINTTKVYENKPLDNETKVIKVKSDDNSTNHWGFYPCWIGDCNFKAAYYHILQHLKDNHAQMFTVHSFKQWPHVINWSLNYNGVNSREDRAFEIQGVGLFNLHIFINHDQHIKARIFMYESGKTAVKYGYEIEIQCEDKRKSFGAEVDSSRIPRNSLHDRNKGLFISSNSLLHNAIKQNLKYKCSVQIKKLDETSNDKRNVDAHVGDNTTPIKQLDNNQRKDVQKLKPLNRKQFKPTRKNANNFKDKSNIPELLDLKTTKLSVNHVQSTHNCPPRAAGIHPLLPQQLYPNLQKEFNYQQMPQTPQYPQMVNNHFGTNMTPPSLYPHPQVIKDEQAYQRSASPFVNHHPHNAGNQSFGVPTQPSAPSIDIEFLHISRNSNKPGNFTAADLERQKSIQQKIEEREKIRLIESGAEAFDINYDDDKKKHNSKSKKNSSDFHQKKPSGDCVVS